MSWLRPSSRRRDRTRETVGAGCSGGARGGDATQRLRAVLATQAASQLIGSLDDPSPDVARAAIRRLAALDGQRAVPELIARLLDAELPVVAELAAALRRLGGTQAVELAIAGLSDASYKRRQAAALALAAFGDVRAVHGLRATLDDEIAGVRIAVLGAVAKIGADGDAQRDCARLLLDPDAHVRIAAVRAVARMRFPFGTQLARLADDRERLVRLEVARHLAVLPDGAAARLLADSELWVREAAARGAGRRDMASLAWLLANDPAGEVRHAAASTLGRLGGEQVFEQLAAGLEDTDAIVRAAALRGLVELHARVGTIVRLRRELSSRRPERRRACLFALAHLQARDAAAEVERLAEDPVPDVRLALVNVAERLLDDPERVIRPMAADADPGVSGSAGNWLVRRH
jgi:HEAT repeat protein